MPIFQRLALFFYVEIYIISLYQFSPIKYKIGGTRKMKKKTKKEIDNKIILFIEWDNLKNKMV